MTTDEFRKEVSGFWKNAPPFAELTKYTYYTSAWGCFMGCSLRIGMS